MENVEEKQVEILDPYGFIYITTNMVNGKKYIGQKMFYGNHWEIYLGSGINFLKAVKKYGKENFHKDIIAITYSKEEANKLEIEFINNHNAVESDEYYNLVGGGNTTAGLHWSEEGRKNLSNAVKGVKKSEETRKRMSIGKRASNIVRKVICITTGEVFVCITDGAEKYDVNRGSISRCCRGRQKSAGIHSKTGDKLTWMYLEDYYALVS